jgi:hypothetical protein
MVNFKWTLFIIHSHNYKIMNMNFISQCSYVRIHTTIFKTFLNTFIKYCFWKTSINIKMNFVIRIFLCHYDIHIDFAITIFIWQSPFWYFNWCFSKSIFHKFVSKGLMHGDMNSNMENDVNFNIIWTNFKVKLI